MQLLLKMVCTSLLNERDVPAMPNVAGLDVPPPGAGLATVTVCVPALARSPTLAEKAS